MTCSNEILKNLRKCFPVKTRVTLLNPQLVLSHAQFSSLMLIGTIKNLRITLETQLNWGTTMCF